MTSKVDLGSSTVIKASEYSVDGTDVFGDFPYVVKSTFKSSIPSTIFTDNITVGSVSMQITHDDFHTIKHNVSANPGVTDQQWISLLRKKIELRMSDKELTDFLMEDALKNK